MSTVMKISPQGQIRIPKKLLASLHIGPGDYVQVEIENGQLVLKPRKLVDPSQAWYWSKEWQKMEAEASQEIEKKQVSPIFKNAEDGLKWLNE